LNALSDFFEAGCFGSLACGASGHGRSLAAIVDRVREAVQPLVRAARATGGVRALRDPARPAERAVQPSLSASYAAAISG
jgi:hypothetical protein